MTNNIISGRKKEIISIVIPTYNRAESISISIQSVLDQSAANWELIIIDDGSTDNTGEAIQYLSVFCERG